MAISLGRSMSWLRSPPRAGALIRARRFRPERKRRYMGIRIITGAKRNPLARRGGENLFCTTEGCARREESASVFLDFLGLNNLSEFFAIAPISRYSCCTMGDFLLLRGSLMQLRDVETATIASNRMLGELARQVRASFKPIVDLSQRCCQRVLALLYGPA